jgi:hypothetical protein
VAAGKRYEGLFNVTLSVKSALFGAPDVLCLDKPINHLDLEAILWLQVRPLFTIRSCVAAVVIGPLVFCSVSMHKARAMRQCPH